MAGGGVRKGAWTAEEDSLLRKCLQIYGEGKWHQVPLRAGLNRCRKSCRLRWLNYLRPNIKRGNFSLEEVDLIVRLHKLLGNRWSLIAGRLPGRTANDVKNYWNTHQIKKCKAKHESDSSTMKPTKATTPRIQVLKPRPRTFTRHNIITSFSSKDEKSTPIIPNNNDNDSIKRIPSIENIIDKTLSSSPSLENSAMELFNSLFQNVDNEAGRSWPSQLSVDEEEMMNRFFSEEIPTYVVDGNNEGGDDSNNKDKTKTLIWDNNTDHETAIDMDICDLLGSS